MKIKHPKFGEIEATPAELMELERLSSHNLIQPSRDEGIAAFSTTGALSIKEERKQRQQLKKYQNSSDLKQSYTDEEYRFIISNLDKDVSVVTLNPVLRSRHTYQSVYAYLQIFKKREYAKMSKRARKILEEMTGERTPEIKKQKDLSPITVKAQDRPYSSQTILRRELTPDE